MKFYKKWAFRLFIYVLILNFLAFLQTIRFAESFDSQSQFETNMLVISIFSALCLIAGLIMVGITIKNRDLNDIKSWVATIGLIGFLVFTLIA
ncbi:MAG TPA: hypothetical protein DDX98_00915, partial [Bacteroidales bacterium]|nr:hypothetical protein [Bacteroidales bacterium]